MFLSKFYIFNAREEEKKPSFTLIRKECHQNMLSVPVGTTQKSMSILWGIHPYLSISDVFFNMMTLYYDVC